MTTIVDHIEDLGVRAEIGTLTVAEAARRLQQRYDDLGLTPLVATALILTWRGARARHEQARAELARADTLLDACLRGEPIMPSPGGAW